MHINSECLICKPFAYIWHAESYLLTFPRPSSLSTIVEGFPLPPDTSTCMTPGYCCKVVLQPVISDKKINSLSFSVLLAQSPMRRHPHPEQQFHAQSFELHNYPKIIGGIRSELPKIST